MQRLSQPVQVKKNAVNNPTVVVIGFIMYCLKNEQDSFYRI